MSTFPKIGIALVTLIAIAAVRPAQAQGTEVDADFQKYCREKFNNSAYQRRQQSWGTEHACMQGGTAQGIDLGEACRLTTGSRQYRELGPRVLCAPGGGPDSAGGPGGQALTTEDFMRYCRNNFPNSSYEKHNEPSGPEHYCRRPGTTGGFTLQNINLSAACSLTKGAAAFTRSGGRIICGSGGASKAARGGKPGDFRKLPRPGRAGGGPLSVRDLGGCGLADPERTKWMMYGPNGKLAGGWGVGGAPLPCPGLTDGREVDLAGYCRAHDAWKTGGRKTKVMNLVWVDGGRPTCVYPNWHKGDPAPPIVLLQPCMWATGMVPALSQEVMVDFIRRIVVGVRFVDRRLECFYLQKADHARLVKGG